MFSKVVALAPDSFHGYDNLGAAYLGQGQYPEAIETFKHSISLRPTAYAYTNIGTAYFYMHQFDDAANNDEQALKLGGGDFELWWNLGDALYWNPAKKSQAEHAYRQCISLGTAGLFRDGQFFRLECLTPSNVVDRNECERKLPLSEQDRLD